MDATMTKTIIANLALIELRANTITTLTDGSTEATIMNTIYNSSRDEALGEYWFSFATKTAILDTGDPSTGAVAWVTSTPYTVNTYVTNSGTSYFCLVSHTSGTFATDLAAGYWTTVLVPNFTDGVNSAYKIPSDFIGPQRWNLAYATMYTEKGFIFSDTTGIVIKYIYSNDDPTSYSPLFVKALAYRLAADACLALTNDKEKKVMFESMYKDKLADAAAKDSQNSTPVQMQQDEWMQARLNGANSTPQAPGTQSAGGYVYFGN